MSTETKSTGMKPWKPGRRLLTTEQAAEILGRSPDTLVDWRWKRTGPPWIRVTRSCIRYDEAALYAWLDAHTITEIPQASGL